VTGEADEHAGAGPGAAAESQLDDARDVLQEARRRLTEVPAEVVVANHAMGLYELAAIHLGAMPPDLKQAKLAIDAVASLVDGLGDRLGPDAPTMRDALANIRLAFVRIKSSTAAAPPPPEAPEPEAEAAEAEAGSETVIPMPAASEPAPEAANGD
jgi:hypothetical protein